MLQTVDQLKQEILSGALKGHLPGERELAKQLRVGRVTLRAALKILEEAQWTSSARTGVRREVLYRQTPDTSEAPRKTQNCKGKVIVTLASQSLAHLPNNELLVYDETLKYTYPPLAGYQPAVDQFPKAVFNLCVEKLLHPHANRTTCSLITPEFIRAGSLTKITPA